MSLPFLNPKKMATAIVLRRNQKGELKKESKEPEVPQIQVKTASPESKGNNDAPHTR